MTNNKTYWQALKNMISINFMFLIAPFQTMDILYHTGLKKAKEKLEIKRLWNR